MRVLLAGFGTRGDVQPLLALARGLQSRGHSPLVCAPPNFSELASSIGVPFHAVGSDSKVFLARANQRPRTAMTLLKQEIGSHFTALIAAAESHSPDVVIGTASEVAAGSIAEKCKVPYQYLAVCPQAIPSATHAPPYVPWHALPAWLNLATWGTVRAVFNLVGRTTLNRLRVQLGLPPIADVLEAVLPRNALVISDPALAVLPPDLLGVATQVPYFLGTVEDEAPLPDRVRAFLDEGPPPVYVGFGSMNDSKPGETTALIVEAARRAGVRLLLNSGWAGFGEGAFDASVCVAGELPHALIFPHVAAAVHHGGSGTTHAAARAGVPQVLVTHFLDQPYWARRVHALGLGPAGIPKTRLTFRALEQAIRAATAPDVRDRARAFAPKIRTDGVERACDALERMARA